MTETRDLLIEIGTEELPPKALRKLSESLLQELGRGLQAAGLIYADLKGYGAPRRLAVWVQALTVSQPEQVLERRGPALAAAVNEEGKPTAAARGFAGSCGVPVEALESLKNEKGAWLVYRQRRQGAPTRELLPTILAQVLHGLPIPKPMRWSDLPGEFIRPVHWLVLLFGEEVIPATLLGVQAGRETWGHRFHHPESLYLTEPAVYASLLETEGKVLADFTARREAIYAQVVAAAQQMGGKALIEEALLDEVTGLVEWPMALAGRFDEDFLKLPEEVLIATMQDHQKYFPVQDEQGHLLPCFITVCNIESQCPEAVVEGNERVIRPRLTDAAFFYTTDRKESLVSRRERLKKITFQEKLGTVFERTERLAKLAGHIAKDIGGNGDWARRAGLLSKCDLVTEMVTEFPELQGSMGRYYALHDKEPQEVAEALREQYLPRFAGDVLPCTAPGQALSLADRLDTLVGLFGTGTPPSGDKDPYGLRRAALGVLRIIIESELALDLPSLLKLACETYHDRLTENNTAAHVYAYLLERLRGYYLEAGFRPDEIEAVLAVRPDQPLDFDRRLKAVASFRKLPEAESLSAANKRIRNILRKSGERLPAQIESDLLQDSAEQTLAAQMYGLEREVVPLLERQDHRATLTALAGLRSAVDQFFDEVMVMVEDPKLRANRLALLERLQTLFLQVADISRLQV
ncbi:glycine--tRNA ligase subunit beta [Nitrosococcus watsonii]|uniref:Glycine--tRNA ligase beta subunit n=1 Tax=Nitrosococcus watsoni (strain C-113) TaxID=105559 RepID=D8KAR9_NITWC|nr:glycine--tRNA ligase subunit beta [Nitrosococcus watsonii]ADJ29496.1 glycyl-tRNA synthetase, beta subunit [Nitrosococcus watsonii C-113]